MKFGIKRVFRRLGTAILDAAYPRVCPVCKNVISDLNGSVVCDDCASTIEYIGEHYCQKCSQPVDDSFEVTKRCPECSDLKLHFDRTIAVGRYYGGLKELILELKKSYPYIARFLGRILADKLRRQDFINEIDLVVAVPAWRWDILCKNQAELLAGETAKQLGLSWRKSILTKIRRTPKQVSLDRITRIKNLEDAFAVKNARIVKDKNILLIDDVMTTGTTANECAKALKDSGVKRVYVGIVGRTIPKIE